MKIVFDTGVLISFSQTCLLPVFSHIRDDIGEFVITTGVKFECIDRVRNNMRFKLSSLRINDQLNEFIFTVYKSDKELDDKTKEILNLTNSIFLINGTPLHIVDFGEAESMALLSISKSNCLAVDERTTRLLIEDPNALLDILKRKHPNKRIELIKERHDKFKQLIGNPTVIRSVDLLAFAYEKNLLKGIITNKEYLKSALYSLKFNGCAVSFEEIEDYLNALK